MEQLSQWRAKRSGGRITIVGRDETGAEVRVPNVDTIEILEGSAHPVATDKSGDQFQLLSA